MRVFDIALSGLTAQSKRLAVSADNVANQRSLGARAEAPEAGGFVPHRVVQVPLADGGVQAQAVPISPPSIASFEPDAPEADGGGLVPRPNVSLEGETVEQMLAFRSYQANLRVLQIGDRMLGDLLDVLS